MGFVAEILIGLVWQVILQLVFEVLAAFGWVSIGETTRRAYSPHPVFSVLGSIILGGAAGALSAWIIPDRLFPIRPLPGTSLVLAPIATGAIVHLIGSRRRARGEFVSFLATFRGAALFAFVMALVRFLLINDVA